MSIALKNVSYTYAPGTAYETTAIRQISVKIEDGEFVGITGATGCGKSTLIQLMAGLLTPKEGQILLDGKDINARRYDRSRLRRQVGVVFQNPGCHLCSAAAEHSGSPASAGSRTGIGCRRLRLCGSQRKKPVGIFQRRTTAFGHRRHFSRPPRHLNFG